MENYITKEKNVLFVLGDSVENLADFAFLRDHFCGEVVIGPPREEFLFGDRHVFVCGELSLWPDWAVPAFAIAELSFSRPKEEKRNLANIPLGKVPVIIEGAGVYFRQFFDGEGYFDRIRQEHQFQDLTESTKQSMAFRKGIYLSDVRQEAEDFHFHLLRCSSNLSGPTDNLRATDREIIQAINQAAEQVFGLPTELNHVLAQVYENKLRTEVKTKETKAKIKAHSDKTKDMRADGLIAFCTFYESANFGKLEPSAHDRYDWVDRGTSGLTRLHFLLKDSVEDGSLPKEFSVTLYPNSVFMIPLSTNRLYTHAIKPPVLPIDKIPTRLGYVVRSSKMEAVFREGQTYLKEAGGMICLEPMTPEAMEELRATYREENISAEMIQYGQVHFSMNQGDYLQPQY